MTRKNRLLEGIAASPGIVMGLAHVLTQEGQVSTRLLYNDQEVAEELARFNRAVDQTEEELTRLRREIAEDLKEHAHILELHLLILRDRMLLLETQKLIKEQNFNAERALYQAFLKIKEVFQRIGDKHIRGRIQDVEAVYRRLRGHLTGRGASKTFEFPEPVIIVARDLSPAETTHMSSSQVLGFITERGSKTSHTAIIAHSLEIPAVVGLDNATLEIESGEEVIINGLSGRVIVNPDEAMRRSYQVRKEEFETFKWEVAQGSALPAVTSDGHPTRVLANIEQPGDASGAVEAGAVGVGLFRSEFLFMNRGDDLPGEDEQFEAYRNAVIAMKGLPVTIRTVDIGADKPLERMSVQELRHEHVLNPALGLRAIRWSLSEPGLFRKQLRAILRASAFGRVRILIPMVAHLSEVRMTLEALTRARRQLDEAGHAYSHVDVGAMIEVPAAALSLAQFLRYFDFVSIGTNDLIQYTLAIDRADDAVSHLYDPWHPAVVGLIARVIEQANLAGKGVSVCGEMAGDPAFTELLLAMGLRSFSMHPAQIPSIKQRILRADTRRLSSALERVLGSENPQAESARAFAGLTA